MHCGVSGVGVQMFEILMGLFAIRCFKSLRFEFLFFCSRYRETFPVILMEYAIGFAEACCTQVLLKLCSFL
jgi:hypothetical protein